MSITQQQCLAHLQGMVRFPTVSHPDSRRMDFEPFFALHRYLEQVYPLCHQVLKKEVIGKAGLLYHWKGTGEPNRLPLLLMAHQDVVPAGNPGEWTHPPFDAVVEDGYLYGRGTTDCKCNIMAVMEAVEELLRQGYTPKTDVYLAFGYNEEVMGGDGPSAKRIADTLADRGIEIGMVIDECGGCSDGRSEKVSRPVCNIVVGEKGYADFLLTAGDPGGHSSTPGKTSPMVTMAAALQAIWEHPFPYRITPVVRQNLETLAPYSDRAEKDLLGDIEGNWPAIVKILPEDRELSAQFRTTVAPTMIHGSDQANILPTRVEATVNCRLLPGDTLESVQAYLTRWVPEGVTVTLLKGSPASPLSPVDSFGYNLIRRICEENHPGVLTTPSLMLGGTDARYFYGVCKNVYRFSSFYFEEEWGAAHSPRESIPVRVLESGPRFFVELIRRWGEEPEA